MAPPGRKSSGKQKARVEDSDSDGDEGRVPKYDDIQPEYLNQPIDSRQGDSKIRTLIGELSLVVKELKSTAETIMLVAADLASSLSQPEVFENLDYDNLPEDPDEIKKLDKELRAVIDKIFEMTLRSKALSDTRQRLLQGHQITDIFSVYEKAVEGPLAEYQNKTSRQRYMTDKRYTEYREIVFENLYDGKAVPNIKKLIPIEANDEQESDDELEIGAQGTDFKCPLTLQLLVDPVSSKKCPHSFSGEFMRQYLSQSGGIADCPATGCPQKLTLQDIEPNDSLKRRVEAHAARMQRDKETNGGTQKGKSATQYVEMSDSDED